MGAPVRPATGRRPGRLGLAPAVHLVEFGAPIRRATRGCGIAPTTRGFMADPAPGTRRKSAFALARELIGGVRTLAGLEIAQAKAEMAASVGHAKGGSIKLAIAAALALVTIITLLAIIVAALFVLGLWWVALILLVLLIVVTALVAWGGIGELKQIKVKPEATIESVKEDIAWAKRLIKRD